MIFLNRSQEFAALTALEHGLAVVWGRRRVGKTRLLTEWCDRARGVYTVADQSTSELQRDYVARALSTVLPGFADVTYPDWERLLTRLAADARASTFHGPIVFDELPYLVASEPSLPSILQRWIDHDATRARLRVALAGSSQRMMQGLVLSSDAPLYGRASVLLDVKPLEPRYLSDALDVTGLELLDHWTAWGGIPRYWELAATRSGSARDRLVALALDPIGPLFTEPERLLLEESPSAVEVRPLLDAIGGGAHRLSEIASRLGRPATSLTKPIDRLLGMGLVRREVPFGEPARGGKRSLYKIEDPFLRAWFRVVAPNRAALTVGTTATRTALLRRHWDRLRAEAWEELSRSAVPVVRGPLARLGPWQPARRHWHGDAPEWDVVADAVDGNRVLAGEAWFSARTVSRAMTERVASEVAVRPLPPMRGDPNVIRALFVPAVAKDVPRRLGTVHIVTLGDLVGG